MDDNHRRSAPRATTAPLERRLTAATLARLNETRRRVMRGRVFTVPTEALLRESRESTVETPAP
jgi:hypothetical protein